MGPLTLEGPFQMGDETRETATPETSEVYMQRIGAHFSPRLYRKLNAMPASGV